MNKKKANEAKTSRFNDRPRQNNERMLNMYCFFCFIFYKVQWHFISVQVFDCCP